MLKVPMNADIKEYSPKVVYGLDKRQLVCTTIALSYGLPFMRFATALEITDRIAVAIILMMPVLACGWLNMYGLPMERFLWHIIVHHIMTPKNRIYKTENSWVLPEEDGAEPVKTSSREKHRKKKLRKEELKKYGGIR